MADRSKDFGGVAMELSLSTWWWIVAGALAAAELASGTFYLLMVAIGCAAGALAAHAQLGFFPQAVVAAAVGGGLVLAWHRLRARAPAALPPEANRDINLDIGEQLQVDGWNADGTARVPYRGSAWNVRYIGDGPAVPGAHVIAEVRHNELALRRA
jgi:membrane protein implicated in regulation of membrane protease activity